MRMLKVLACIYDYDLLRDLMEQARNCHTVKLLALSTLPKDVKIVEALDIDVCLLECDADQKELRNFVMQLQSQQEHPRIIYLIDRHDLRFGAKDLLHLHECYCLYAPFQGKYILQELTKRKEESQHKMIHGIKEDRMASDLIQSMGIPVHLNGYHYLKTTAILLLRYEREIASMKQLYKDTARVHKTTVSRVEKAIRGAVDYAYRSDPSRIEINGRRPTNSQLIHNVCEKLKARLHEEERELVL